MPFPAISSNIDTPGGLVLMGILMAHWMKNMPSGTETVRATSSTTLQQGFLSLYTELCHVAVFQIDSVVTIHSVRTGIFEPWFLFQN